MKRLTIVIPAFNEERNLVAVFEAVQKVMSELSYAWDVMFVDDGSRDRSVAVMKELAAKEPGRVGYIELSHK